MGIVVAVVPSSLTAEPFYTKLGFQTVRDVYHGNERTLVMEKVLSSRHPIWVRRWCAMGNRR